VPTYWGINQVIVPGNISGTLVRINAIAFISVSVAESIVLYEQEFLAPEVSCICPGSIAMGVAAPSIVEHPKSQ
jgi:hypothetical protein